MTSQGFYTAPPKMARKEIAETKYRNLKVGEGKPSRRSSRTPRRMSLTRRISSLRTSRKEHRFEAIHRHRILEGTNPELEKFVLMGQNIVGTIKTSNQR